MSRIFKTLAIALLTAVTAVPALAQYRRYVRPPVIVRPHFYYGPGFYRGSPYYWGWDRGYWEPGYVVHNVGDVKLETHLKYESLYVDGGYVGPIGKFKRFELTPGNHLVEVRDSSDRIIFSRQVGVIFDKTVEVRIPE